MSATEAPVGVDPETGEILDPPVALSDAVAFPTNLRLRTDPLTVDDALLLTAHITGTAKSLCWLVKEAKEREAWKVLGHPSWEDYCDERLRFSRQRADQLYKQALANEAAALAVGLSAGEVNLPEWALRGLNAEDIGRMAGEIVMALPPDFPSRRNLADTMERLLRERIAEHRAQVSASTAVDVGGTETTTTTRATVSTTTTTKPSSDQHPPSDDASGGQDPAPAAPGAPTPDAGDRTGDRDGADESDEAAPPADGSEASDGGGAITPVAESPASSGAGPDADLEPAASGPTKAQVSRAFAAALVLLTAGAAEAAALLTGDERDDRAQDCERLTDWLLAHHDAVMDRTLRSVG